jgi:hypothetical protein
MAGEKTQVPIPLKSAEGIGPQNEIVSVSSFIVRFVHAKPAQGEPSYRGHIRHIQTDLSCNFTHWDAALAFIKSFVPAVSDSMGESADEDDRL